MTVLLTGANGFLGASLMEMLIEKNYNVVALTRSTSNTKRIAHLIKKVNICFTDKESLDSIFKKFDIDLAIHTATLQRRNKPKISEFIESNVLFTLELLENAIAQNVKKIIYVDTMLPKYVNDYALSKHQASEWFKYFEKNIKIINVALELFFGPNEDSKQFVKSMILDMLSEKESINLTEGLQKRDIIYIKDVVSAFECIVENIDCLDSSTRIEVGLGTPIEVKDIVKMIKKLTNSSSRLNFGAIAYGADMPMEFVANTQILKSLGWNPKYSLEEALKETILQIKG